MRDPESLRAVTACAIALGISLGWSSTADAHRRILGTYQVQVEGADARWALRVDAVDIGRFFQVDQNQNDEYEESELQAARPAIEVYLQERLWLSTDGVSCGSPTIETMRGDDPTPHWLDITGTFVCPQPMGIVEVGNRVLFDHVDDYQHFVEFETPAGVVNRILNSGRPSIRIRVAEPQSGEDSNEGGEGGIALPSGGLGRIGLFVKEGLRHVFIGPDHILFILGLAIAAASLRRLAVIVTAFTIAHSITLALASLEILTINIDLAEALIALSVAYVGFENAVREPRHRWALAFGFGLIHGIGFSSVLGDLVSITSLDGAGRAQLLIGFNVGVELAQLVIVTATFPLIAWLRRRRWQRPIVRFASFGIFAVGVFWFVERAF